MWRLSSICSCFMCGSSSGEFLNEIQPRPISTMHLVCVRHFSFINKRDLIRSFTHLLRRMRIGVKQLHAVAFAVLANDFTSVLWFSIMNNHMLHHVWSCVMHVMVFG